MQTRQRAACCGRRAWRGDAVGALTEDKLLVSFEAWLLQGLLPALPNGTVAIMGNAPFHKSERIQEAVEAAGCLVETSSVISS